MTCDALLIAHCAATSSRRITDSMAPPPMLLEVKSLNITLYTENYYILWLNTTIFSVRMHGLELMLAYFEIQQNTRRYLRALKCIERYTIKEAHSALSPSINLCKHVKYITRAQQRLGWHFSHYSTCWFDIFLYFRHFILRRQFSHTS